MKVLVLLALLGLVAAQTFQGQVVIRNDPNVVGTVTANIFYSFPANRTRFDYTQIGGGIQEFFEFGALVSVRFLVCPGTCQAETLKTPILRLFREGNEVAAGTVQVTDLNGVSRTCNRLNKVNVPAGGVTQIAVEPSNNNIICQASFANGKRFDFFNVVGLQGNPFAARPANCPQPQCSKKQDIMLVFDESGSINNAAFIQERQFGIDFANTFSFGPNEVGMGLVQFDSVSRTTIPLTFDKTSFINQMSVITQRRQATCIGCGIQDGRIELQSVRGRAQATKTMVVLTDGRNNVNTGAFPGILQTAKNAGITMVAIGVANAVASEINTIASAPNLAFFATDFSKLSGILNDLATATCEDINGNPCGAGCKGFCGCNQQCLCPDVCENNDRCVNPVCNVNQNGAGCQFPRNVVCNDNDACTTDTCNSATGCVFNRDVVCNDNNRCTNDACVSPLGCVHTPVDCTPTPPDPCNNFNCNPANGNCVPTPIFCDLCVVNNVVCPPIPCQINVCNSSGICQATPKQCNSNNKCIIDSCNPATDQCVQTALVCNDNNACTDDSCNPAIGCVFTPFDAAVRCNDSSVCTTDTCVPATGCTNTNIDCPRSNICKEASCNSVLGCQEADVDCGAVLSVIDPNKQGNCYIAACDPDVPNPANQGRDGCVLSQLPGTTIDRCGFCAAPGTQSPFCFIGLDAGAAAGLGGGVIAAIVIGAVVAAVVAVVSGKKGYDVWVKHRNNMQGAQANPMYEDSGRSGNNPFFEARS